MEYTASVSDAVSDSVIDFYCVVLYLVLFYFQICLLTVSIGELCDLISSFS